MAKCTIDPVTGCILTISGKLGGTIYKTYKNGQVRAYLSQPAQRSTPLSKNEIVARHLFSVAATVTKRRIEAGDTRRRTEIFREVYASLKSQLAERERNGIGTEAEPVQVLPEF